ncbi:MAG: glutaredoxin domain-containing protein [Patescibacteria group bacterium]
MTQKTVTVYSTPTCHFCHMAKDFFTAHNIAFTDHNVGSDLEQRKLMIEKSGQMGVPVIVVADAANQSAPEDIIIGFDEEHLRSLLGISS